MQSLGDPLTPREPSSPSHSPREGKSYWKKREVKKTPPVVNDDDFYELSRLYTFNILPDDLFPRLLVKLLGTLSSVVAIWRSGIAGSFEKVKVLVEQRLPVVANGEGGAVGSGTVVSSPLEVCRQ